MPDFDPRATPGLPLPADTLPVLLDLLPTGVAYCATGPADAAPVLTYLNPAAQRLLALPAAPGLPLARLWPAAAAALAAPDAADGPTALALPHPAHPDAPLRALARRHGAGWLLTLEADDALPAARAEAERQRRQLHHVLEQAPAMICIFEGPQHVFGFVNPPYQALVGARPLVGKPIAEAMPELAGQPIFALLDHVYRTGETFRAHEMLVQLDHDNEGRRELEQRYYNFIYQARRDLANAIDGILVFAYEVTPQVQARQRLEQLNEELELRVTARSAETRAALFETEQQRAQLAAQQALLGQILGQVPASIATLGGPQHRFTFFNEQYQALVGGRAALGRPVADCLPEVTEQGFIELLDRVYATGEAHVGAETAILLHPAGAGHPAEHYLNFVYQPLFDDQRRIQGILAFVVDVTEQVRSRKQAATLQAALLGVAQRQAQERQDLLDLFRQAPAAIALLREPDHRLDYHNQAFEELFPAEAWAGPLRGHTLEEVYPAIRPAGLAVLLDQVYATGEGQIMPELPLALLQPGSPRFVTLVYQAYREQGRIAGVAAFAFDVSAQVLGRQARDKAQAELQRLFEHAPTAIYVLHGPGLVMTIVNPAMQQMLGRPAAELLGRPHFEAMPELAGQGYPELLAEVWRTGQPYAAQAQPARLHHHAPGETGYYDFVYQPLFDAEGRISDVMCMATDVTEQVLARRAREAQQAELQRVFEQAPVAIAILRGPALRIELANAAVAAIWGRPAAQVLGRPYFEALPETAGQGFEEILGGVLATGRPFSVVEAPVQLARTNPEQVAQAYVNFTFQPLPNERGQVDGIIAIGTEVTEQVLARQQVQDLNHDLTAANQRLRRSNADLDTFVYTASHDLRAPIVNLEGLHEALRELLPAAATLDAQVPPVLNMMDGAVARFQQTLRDLTEVGRLQGDLLDEAATPVELAALLAAVRLDMAAELAAAGAVFDLDVAACPAVLAPARTLRSVLYNLVSNAAKYRDPVRPLRIGVRGAVAAGRLTLAVADNGLGLTPEQQAGLFQLYRRQHTHVPGSGVGLYMVRRLVENAGGSIVVTGAAGQGTTFTVSLPVAG